MTGAPDISKNNIYSPDQMIGAMGAAAKRGAAVLAKLSTDDVNKVLLDIAARLRDQKNEILIANAQDLEIAYEKELSGAMLDRLILDDGRIEGMAKGLENIASLDDPAGRTLWEAERSNGLSIKRVAVPIGVLGMIYESRPNVTVDAAALCLKSRNAVILRGGSESLHSSLALHSIIQESLESNNIPKESVSMVPLADREMVGAMLRASKYIDVMIPRGGRGLIERVMKEARMPVFGHLEGVCHIYIHPSVKPEIAREVTFNAKMRRTGICGALETLLLDKALSPEIVCDVLTTLLDGGCEIVGDEAVQKVDSRIGAASDEDWSAEYLDAKLSCKFVESIETAVNHINSYGSHHTDSILCQDSGIAEIFLNSVDSGIVLHNASTQFADGGEFGMGAEIGIATGKLHARGPVGLEQLCSYKYIVRGNGQTRP